MKAQFISVYRRADRFSKREGRAMSEHRGVDAGTEIADAVACPVRLPCPGRRVRVATRISKASLFVLLTVLSFIAGLPLHAMSSDPNGQNASNPSNGTKFLNGVGSDPVPNLRLPRTVLSTVDDLIDTGVLQTSADNITLHSPTVAFRLKGGTLPHDELLSPDHRVLSSYSFWAVQANMTGQWVSLYPYSNTFTALGTNKTGAFVIRTMSVSAGAYSGVLRVVYRAMPSGPLKWSLEFNATSPGEYRLAYTWRNVTATSRLSSAIKQFWASYDRGNYTFRWEDVPSASAANGILSQGQFLFSIDLGVMTKGSVVKVDPSIVGSSTTQYATAYSFQRKVFYQGGYYWVFYLNGTSLVYRNSPDGIRWSAAYSMPSGWPYVDPYGSSPSVINSGPSVIVATGYTNNTNVPLGQPRTAAVYYANGTIAGSTINWSPVRILNKITTNQSCDPSLIGPCMVVGTRYVSVALSSDGTPVFSYNWYMHVNPDYNPPADCTWSVLYVQYKTYFQNLTDTRYHCGPPPIPFNYDNLAAVMVPADSHELIRIAYTNFTCSFCFPILLARWLHANGNLGA